MKLEKSIQYKNIRTKPSELKSSQHHFLSHNKYNSCGMVLQPNVEVSTLRSIWEERCWFTGFNLRLSRWFGESEGFSCMLSLLSCVIKKVLKQL